MDKQEQRRQHKEKEREHEKKAEKVYEDESHKRRLPLKSAWVIVLGIVLVLAVIYVWTFGLW